MAQGYPYARLALRGLGGHELHIAWQAGPQGKRTWSDTRARLQGTQKEVGIPRADVTHPTRVTHSTTVRFFF